MSVRKLSDISEVMRQIYEPFIRSQIEQNNIMFKMIQPKDGQLYQPKYCYDSVNFGDEYINCELEHDHDGDHVYNIDDDTMKMHVTWPNKKTVDG